MRIAINGFGRIGRLVYRLLADRDDIKVVAINNPYEGDTMAHLLKHDSIHGKFPHVVHWDGTDLAAGTQKTKMTTELEPSKCPWKELNIDLVMECSGKFLTREKVNQHLQAGAKKVLLSAPPKESNIPTYVYGVNHTQMKTNETVYSNASCTTNCIAPPLRVLIDAFGYKRGLFTTVHSYTNDQRLLDFSHKDLRRARAACHSMIPTSTGAAKSTGQVIPEVLGKLEGLSVRVPTPNVSLVDLNIEVDRKTTVDEVNRVLKDASNSDRWRGIIEYTEEELVSSDFNGSRVSSIIDSKLTQVSDGVMIKVIAWYDNETGFSMRMVDMAKYILSKSLT